MQTALLWLFLLLAGGVAEASNTNAPLRSLDVTVLARSPRQSFYLEQHTLSPNEVMQVWIVSSRNPKKRRLLYTHSRSVTVLISDDERWLAINDYAGSDSAELLLFRRKKGLDYKPAEKLSEKAWQFVATRSGRTRRLGLDHQYVEGLRWTDEHTLLLCLHGHRDHRNFVDDWLCLYNVASQTFSTDLNQHNQQHTTLEKER